MVCFFSLGLSLNSKPIEVEISKNKVETGEVFTYTVKIEGIFHKPHLTLPNFDDFKFVSQNQSKSVSREKEGVKRIIILKYFLFAPKPGSFKIEPATLEDKGKKYKSKAISIKVKGKPLEEKRRIQPYIDKGTNI
jgi:hypothetical protein